MGNLKLQDLEVSSGELSPMSKLNAEESLLSKKEEVKIENLEMGKQGNE
jgi:hypothetical protein